MTRSTCPWPRGTCGMVTWWVMPVAWSMALETMSAHAAPLSVSSMRGAPKYAYHELRNAWVNVRAVWSLAGTSTVMREIRREHVREDEHVARHVVKGSAKVGDVHLHDVVDGLRHGRLAQRDGVGVRRVQDVAVQAHADEFGDVRVERGPVEQLADGGGGGRRSAMTHAAAVARGRGS